MTYDSTEAHNAKESAREVADFKANPPSEYFAYVKVDLNSYPRSGKLTTWTGDELGDLIAGRPYQDNFGGTRVPIRVKAINGLDYYGTYYMSSGDYARIKRSKVQPMN